MLYEQIAVGSEPLSLQWQLRLLAEAKADKNVLIPELLCLRDDIFDEVDLLLRANTKLNVRLAYVRAHEGDTKILGDLADRETRQKVLAEIIRCAPALPKVTVRLILSRLSSSVLAAALLAHGNLTRAERAMVATRLTSITASASFLQGDLWHTLDSAFGRDPELLGDLMLSTTDVEKLLALSNFTRGGFRVDVAQHLTLSILTWFDALASSDASRVKLMALRHLPVAPHRFGAGVLQLLYKMCAQPELRTGITGKRIKGLASTIEATTRDHHRGEWFVTSLLHLCEKILVLFDTRAQRLLCDVGDSDMAIVEAAMHRIETKKSWYSDDVRQAALEGVLNNPALSDTTRIKLIELLYRNREYLVLTEFSSVEGLMPFTTVTASQVVALFGQYHRGVIPQVLLGCIDPTELTQKLIADGVFQGHAAALDCYSALVRLQVAGSTVPEGLLDLVFREIPAGVFFADDMGHYRPDQGLSDKAGTYLMAAFGENDDAWLTFKHLAGSMREAPLVTVVCLAAKVLAHG